MIGLVLGILVGFYLNTHPSDNKWLIEQVFQPMGDIFIKLMKMIVIPIVFSCLVVGIAGHSDGKSTTSATAPDTTVGVLCHGFKRGT